MTTTSRAAAREFFIHRVNQEAVHEGRLLSSSEVLRLSGQPVDRLGAAEDLAGSALQDAEILERVEPLLLRAYFGERKRRDKEVYHRHLVELEDDDSLIAVAARSALRDLPQARSQAGLLALVSLALIAAAILVAVLEGLDWLWERFRW